MKPNEPPTASEQEEMTREEDELKPITIFDLAKHRGLKIEEDGSCTGQAFFDVGLDFLGGCCRCHATIAAYNAYPGRNGYWHCRDCISPEEGYATVEEANEAISEESLLTLAKHIVAMENDPYLEGHPEWVEILEEAKAILEKVKIQP